MIAMKHKRRVDPEIFNGGHDHFQRRKAAAPGLPCTVRHPASVKMKVARLCLHKEIGGTGVPPLNLSLEVAAYQTPAEVTNSMVGYSVSAIENMRYS